MAPRAMPSMTTKISLRGVWTKTPARPPARGAAVRPLGRLAPRPDLCRDNVVLLDLDAVDRLADDPADGTVVVHRLDPDPADVLRARLEPVNVEFIPHDQAVIRADRELDPRVAGIDLGDLALDVVLRR